MFNQVVHNSPANDESKAFRFQMFWKFGASARVIGERIKVLSEQTRELNK